VTATRRYTPARANPQNFEHLRTFIQQELDKIAQALMFSEKLPVKVFAVHGDAGSDFVMTSATLAERLAGNTSRHIFLADLGGCTQVRLMGNLQVTGTAGSLFRAKYASTFTTVVGSFLQLGASAQVEFSCSGTGYRDTGWVDMAAGARINGCCIGFTELGGDGVADPALGAAYILFR
jgi:hypothetical protein